MAKLDIITIEDKIQQLLEDDFDQTSFIFEFLSFYDIPKATITRIRKANSGEIKNKLHFKAIEAEKSVVAGVSEIEEAIKDKKSQPRYIIVTNFIDFAAKDTKTGDTLHIPFEDLPSYADFFLAWNGVEKVDYAKENPADIKAAERFTRLYDELKKINHFDDRSQEEKEFNLFLIRLLFLLFAEDTEIMKKGIFTNAVKMRSREDGSDLNSLFNQVFSSLDIANRFSQESWLQEFPYVNGKLFTDAETNLVFDKKTRKLILEAGELLNWNEINPDILGAMIQTVANSEHRSKSGMHYTSVENIMKVIKPLFLDNLTAIYDSIVDKINENEDKAITERTRRENRNIYQGELMKLHERLSKIKFFDPACGSGNFLIITYKELRRLEIQILKTLRHLKNDNSIDFFEESKISLNQFYGIELDDFAHEVARLSLWIAEHQMNVETEKEISIKQAFLPLRDAGNITQGNALRLDWDKVVPHTPTDEIYLIGNPPYIGTKGRNAQSSEQKGDLAQAIFPLETRVMDYIFGWFFKATKFIYNKNAEFAFVSTNSLFQGEQAPIIAENLLSKLDIKFAYPSFKWGNNAKNNAGVIVVIVGFTNKTNNRKYIYLENSILSVDRINVHLKAGADYNVLKTNQLNKNLPFLMTIGSAEYGDDNLIFSIEEYKAFVLKYPKTEYMFKKCINATNLVNGKHTYALWLDDDVVHDALLIPELKIRIKKVREFRSNSKRAKTKSAERTPWKFSDSTYQSKPALIFPVVHPEKREYLPAIFIDENIVPTNANYVIYDAPIWLLGIIVSRMHMVWFRNIGGKLKNDPRYSSKLVFNTFPIPKIKKEKLKELENLVFELIDIREEEGGTLAEQYGGSDKEMNIRVRRVHEKIDNTVESIYSQVAFSSDEDRFDALVNLYNKNQKNEE